MSPSAVRACLRIARRDLLRARGRSALILVMVALPVLGMASADVLFRSAQLSPNEKATRAMGAADAVLYSPDGLGQPVQQDPSGTTLAYATPAGEGAGTPHELTEREVTALLPGARILIEQSAEVSLRRAGAAGAVTAGAMAAQWRGVDYGDPLLAGLLEQRSGRVPRRDDEAAVTPRVADELDLGIGSTVVTAGGQRFRVVGVVRDPQALSATQIIGLPGALPTDPVKSRPPRFYLSSPAPVDWAQVQRLNAQGIVAISRAVLQNPPPASQIPGYDPGYERRVRLAVIGVALLVVGLATLEVVLLAGAAFAVGARRQRRSLALIAASGGEPRHVRSVVLGAGALLGAAGATVGLVAGTAVAWASRGWFAARQDKLLGHFEVRPLEMLVIAAVGTVTGVLAAVMPARAAARADVVAVLAGRAGIRSTPLRVPLLGLVIAGIGVLVAALGAGAGSPLNGAKLILAGTIAVQLGALILTPAVVGMSGRLGRHLPFTGRLALRDAARHRGRTAPAVGAIMAAVAGSTALALYAVSDSHHAQRQYQPMARTGVAVVQLGVVPDRDQLERLRTELTRTLPARSVEVVRGIGCNVGYAADCNVYVNLQIPPQPCDADTGECGYSFTSAFNGPTVGGSPLLRALAGRPLPAAEAALAAGKVVVFAPNAVREGMATFDVQSGGSEQPREVRLPAVASPPVAGLPLALIPQATASRLGPVVPVGLAVDSTRMPTAQQEEAARGAVNAVLTEAFLSVERGYHPPGAALLLALLVGTTVITLGAAGVATGLAAADGRADMATLAAVGAAPRTRRVLAAAQALTVATLGTVLGVAVGFVPAVAYIHRLPGYRVEPPWVTLAVMVLAVPALAALLAGAVTRSRLPLERRLA